MDRFETNFLDSYTDEGLLDEIRRVATVHAGGPLTKKAFQRLSGRVAVSTVQRRFGGWKEALERAGVGDLYGGKKISSKMTAQAARGMTEADLLAEMKRVHAQLGTGILTKDDFDRTSIVTASGAIRGRFGSWKKAMAKADHMARRSEPACDTGISMTYKGYRSKVELDEEAGVFHGEVINVRDVITFQGTSVEELKRAFEDSVDDYLEFCVSRGETCAGGVPTPNG